MSTTYSVYANGVEVLETDSRKQAIQTAKTKADELQTMVKVYENDETNGEQYLVMTVEPKGVAQ